MSGMIANLSTRMQVALITGMLPDCGRNCNREAEQLRDGLPEQLQDKITVATVDSYQARTDSLRCVQKIALLCIFGHCVAMFSYAPLHRDAACAMPSLRCCATWCEG